ncbi:MAG: hypothetical protein DRP74_03155 [Candidatus Omnitrophota bacterium]|nr:MAG: hypothetical protein DRP74_03155 [Candidatus Omnitrophota bacterium]
MQIKKIINFVSNFLSKTPLGLIPRERIVIGALLLLGTALLLHQSLLGRKIQKLKSVKMEVGSQKKLLQQKQNISQNPGILLKQIKEIERQYNQLKEKFINEQDLSDFFDTVRQDVKRTNNKLISLELQSLRPLNQEELSDKGMQGLRYHQILPFTITLEGDYVGTLLFMHNLEEQPCLLELNNFKINSDSKNPAQVLLEMNFNLYVTK